MSFPKMASLALGSIFAPQKRPRDFTHEELSSASTGSAFPKGFLMGAATAAHQVEGGLQNDWTDWEDTAYPDGKPHIADGTRSGRACDSWNRFDDDLRCLQELNANAYRWSIEWARLEPEEGRWNQEAADRYKSWMDKLAAAGIKSMVTAYHFTLPRWVAADGGWQNDKTIDRFEAFVRKVFAEFGTRNDFWCTVNEPSVVAIQGYLRGIWPPGLKDEAATARVMARVLKGHARAAAILRQTGKPVGLAHHVRLLHPASWSPMDKMIARFSDHFVNDAVVDCQRTGRIQILIPGKISIDEPVDGLKGSSDYLGINYYTRDHVKTDLKDPSMSRQFVPEGRPKSDLGWDIYPAGLHHALLRWKKKLNLPIYITENGIADATGERRSAYLTAHLYAIERALRDGADVRGYFHWCLMDNFEWAEGFSARFGLYRMDYTDPELKRVPTPAVRVFQEFAKKLAAAGKG